MAADTPVTGEDIVSLALTDAGVLGIGQTANAYDTSNALRRLNWMLAQWRMKRWLVYHLVTVGLSSTGAQSYTIGPAGDINVDVRPDRLEAAFCRQTVQSQPNQIDYPLELLQSREDYNEIALKQLTSFPSYVFYDSGWPLGTIYPWPVPQANLYAVYVSVKAVLTEIAVLADPVLLPQEYMLALYLSLAELLRMGYQMPPDPMLGARAKEAREVLRGSNYQIARLRMPTELTRPGVYNPYSDQIR